jgi:hypothetical protein
MSDIIPLSEAARLLGINNKDHRRSLERWGVPVQRVAGIYMVRRTDVEVAADSTPPAERPRTGRPRTRQVPDPAQKRRPGRPRKQVVEPGPQATDKPTIKTAADYLRWLKERRGD